MKKLAPFVLHNAKEGLDVMSISSCVVDDTACSLLSFQGDSFRVVDSTQAVELYSWSLPPGTVITTGAIMLSDNKTFCSILNNRELLLWTLKETYFREFLVVKLTTDAATLMELKGNHEDILLVNSDGSFTLVNSSAPEEGEPFFIGEYKTKKSKTTQPLVALCESPIADHSHAIVALLKEKSSSHEHVFEFVFCPIWNGKGSTSSKKTGKGKLPPSSAIGTVQHCSWSMATAKKSHSKVEKLTFSPSEQCILLTLSDGTVEVLDLQITQAKTGEVYQLNHRRQLLLNDMHPEGIHLAVWKDSFIVVLGAMRVPEEEDQVGDESLVQVWDLHYGAIHAEASIPGTSATWLHPFERGIWCAVASVAWGMEVASFTLNLSSLCGVSLPPAAPPAACGMDLRTHFSADWKSTPQNLTEMQSKWHSQYDKIQGVEQTLWEQLQSVSNDKDLSGILAECLITGEKSKTEQQLHSPHLMREAMRHCLNAKQWDLVIQLLQTNVITCQGNPTLLTAILQSGKLDLLEALLLHVLDVSSVDLGRILTHCHGLVVNSKSSKKIVAFVHERSVPASHDDHCEDYFYNLIVCYSSSKADMRATLRGMDSTVAVHFLAYLARWTQLCSEQSTDALKEMLGSKMKIPRYETLIAWETSMVDSHMMDFISVPEMRAPAQALLQTVEEDLAACRAMETLSALVSSVVANSKLQDKASGRILQMNAGFVVEQLDL